MSQANFQTASKFGIKALKESLTVDTAAGAPSEKAKSALKSQSAATSQKNCNRPQTALLPPKAPSSSATASSTLLSKHTGATRKSLIQQAVAVRDSHVTTAAPGFAK